MFNEEEDWSDGEDAQATIKTSLKDSLKTNSSTKLKSKAVGKKSLLRTLQTLGSVPEWKNQEDHIQDSDSDSEAGPTPSPSKKKKRRKKKRKTAEASGEQQENADESAKEEKPTIKKMKKDRKSGAPKAESASTKVENITDCDQLDVNKPQSSDKLSRRKWKNKMKNKKKCKNKYRQDEPEGGANKAADKTELKREVKMDSHSNNCSLKISEATTQKKKEKERQKLKRENTEKPLVIEDETKSKGEIPALQSKHKTNESKVEITDVEKQISNIKLKPDQSKEQNLKREKLRKLLQSQTAEQHESPAEPQDESVLPEESEAAPNQASSFRSRMEQRLESARFRYINEVLYSTSSGEAKRMFKQDPQAFWVYHKGYTAQVQRWPSNPVDSIIAYIKKQSSSLVVADFGCGDCKVARSVKNKVHSFDLAATCELVTVCDMARVPLKDGSVDIAVFCLSLMGTNLTDFVSEANRVLRTGGVLKVAEVASRFDNVRNFITALSRLGFKLESKNTENTHFYSFDFEKTGNVPETVKKLGLQLKPCLYKKR